MLEAAMRRVLRALSWSVVVVPSALRSVSASRMVSLRMATAARVSVSAKSRLRRSRARSWSAWSWSRTVRRCWISGRRIQSAYSMRSIGSPRSRAASSSRSRAVSESARQRDSESGEEFTAEEFTAELAESAEADGTGLGVATTEAEDGKTGLGEDGADM
jgi:hypothetical protein